MQQINVDAVMEGNIAQNLGIFGEQLGLLQNETGDMIERITTILANYLAEIESADGEQDAYIVQIDELRYAESGCFSFRINYILGILQDE